VIRHPNFQVVGRLHRRCRGAAWLLALAKVMRHIYHSSDAREALRSIERVKALSISQGLSK